MDYCDLLIRIFQILQLISSSKKTFSNRLSELKSTQILPFIACFTILLSFYRQLFLFIIYLMFFSLYAGQPGCFGSGPRRDPCLTRGLRYLITTSVFTARCYASAVLAMSLCLSVCLSVTSRSSTKPAKLRIKQTTPHDSRGSLVFCRQRSPRNSTGVTPYWGDKCRWGGSKSATFDK